MPSSPVPQSVSQSPQPQVAVLDGVLERVTFCNPETGYTIARVAPDRGTGRGTGRGPVSAATELVTVVGSLLGAQAGESLQLRGRWSSHVKYGRQVDVHSAGHCSIAGYIDWNPGRQRRQHRSRGRRAVERQGLDVHPGHPARRRPRDPVRRRDLPLRLVLRGVGLVGPYGLSAGTGLSGFWNGKTWRLVAAR